jgi:hypothetical protein
VARPKKRDDPPAKSNRGRPDARGVFIVFEQEEEHAENEPRADADQALARDDDCDEERR